MPSSRRPRTARCSVSRHHRWARIATPTRNRSGSASTRASPTAPSEESAVTAWGFGTASDGSLPTSTVAEPSIRSTVATTVSPEAPTTSHPCHRRTNMPVGISRSSAMTATVLAMNTPSATALSHASPLPFSMRPTAAASSTQAAKISAPATHSARAAPWRGVNATAASPLASQATKGTRTYGSLDTTRLCPCRRAVRL